MNRKKHLVLTVLIVVVPGLIPGCGSNPQDDLSASSGTRSGLPDPVSARALSRHYVVVTFPGPVGEEAEVADSYVITGPDQNPLTVEEATLRTGAQQVLLTTGAQELVEYQLNIQDPGESSPDALIDGGIQFSGSPGVEPFLETAIALSNTSVLLTFNEWLDKVAAETVPSYRIAAPELDILNATLGVDRTTVLLTTSPMVNVEYNVKVTNVLRENSEHLIDPTRNTATFFGIGIGTAVTNEFDAPGRVVGAISTSNTSVVVSFNKVMSDGAEDASNYAIVQENVQPEAGALIVTAASFLGPDRTAVELTTLSQNELTYRVTVVNVTDILGGPLATPGVLVTDPTSATFPGTPPDNGVPGTCVGGSKTNDPCIDDSDCPGLGGTCEGRIAGDLVDTDGDGLTDNTEQRGWFVIIVLSDGSTAAREVTSNPFLTDTDGDGLDDWLERRLLSDPRSPDTDGDQLTDNEEFNLVFSSLTNQDSDGDGLSDPDEVNFFKTNANVADSDGDGFDDFQELFEMNRDPRIADLPQPQMVIGTVGLHLEEEFTFTDEHGDTQTEESTSSVALVNSRTKAVLENTETVKLHDITFGLKLGIDGGLTNFTALGSGELVLKRGTVVQVSKESSEQMTNVFELSLTKGLAITDSTSFTRSIVGGRVDALVSFDNLSDVAFSLSNVEITVSTPDPTNRTSFVPVATLVPNSTLVTGDSAVFNIGAFDAARGPILFSSLDVFPSLVEDLLRDPRGLLFEFANFDLTDEFGRNFAFTSQTVRDRTVGLVFDFGDGNLEHFLVASAPVRNRSGNIVGGFAGVPGTCVNGADDGESCLKDNDCTSPGTCVGRIEPFGGIGPLPPVPLEYILEEVLLLRRSSVEVPAIWSAEAALRPLVEKDSDGNIVPPDGILVGPNGVSDTVAIGDDVQRIPFGIDGLPEDAVVVDAGEDGVLQSAAKSTGDVLAVITGYSTTMTCGPNTTSSIRVGPNRIVDTLRDPVSDDVQTVLPGVTDVSLTTDVITAGSNGFIDTAPAGDDVFVGPGVPCRINTDCPGAGQCDGQERLFRFKRRENGQFGRFWAVLTPNDDLLGVDFRKSVLRPGEVLTLAFIQDLDRDGLISSVEFLFGSSDTKQDTDGDLLDDFSEIRVGWEVGVEGENLRRVFPDPRLSDSDRDGLSDREEQDIRRVQCECVGGPDDGEACTRNNFTSCAGGVSPPPGTPCTVNSDCDTDNGGSCPDVVEETEACRPGCGGGVSPPPGTPCTDDSDCDTANGGSCPDDGNLCKNIADSPVTDCSTRITDNRTDPRRRDTDEDRVSDGDEVLGWLTQAAIIDPKEVILAGSDRDADTIACLGNVCMGGSKDSEPCRFQRDCPPQKQCVGGESDGDDCVNDIECQGATPATSGLCEDTGLSHVCNHTACDDVQVVPVDTVGLDPRTVVVAPGPNGVIDTTTVAGDLSDPDGDLKANTSALGDDQQIALVDPARALVDNTLGRTIIRPGVNGVLDSLPVLDDVLAAGQFIQTTDPLKPDTDGDQISEGLERLLGSDPRNAADGGFLTDADGDGLTDGQEEIVGWIVRANGGSGVDVYSNANAGDSDLDGLPDFVEFLLRTNPNDTDTDGDGLSDFDELSEDQFTEFEKFNEFFPGFVLVGDTSAMYGTDPLDCDTDDDGLTDDFEVLEGWDVTIPTQEGGIIVFHVFTDPTNPDTDFDGLPDGAEFKHRPPDDENGNPSPIASTDPTDFDSDRDQRVDGVECPGAPLPAASCTDITASQVTCASDPLIADKSVRVRFVQMTLLAGSDGCPDSCGAELGWSFGAHKSTEFFPGTILTATNATACGPNFGAVCTGLCSAFEGQITNFGESAEKTFNLKPGEGILLHGVVDEFDVCPLGSTGGTCVGGAHAGEDCSAPLPGTFFCCDFDPFCLLAGQVTCGTAEAPADGDTSHVAYFRSIDYEDLEAGFTTDIPILTDATRETPLIVQLLVEITVD